jgi:uncharacterized membrane-anchored protein
MLVPSVIILEFSPIRPRDAMGGSFSNLVHNLEIQVRDCKRF